MAFDYSALSSALSDSAVSSGGIKDEINGLNALMVATSDNTVQLTATVTNVNLKVDIQLDLRTEIAAKTSIVDAELRL